MRPSPRRPRRPFSSPQRGGSLSRVCYCWHLEGIPAVLKRSRPAAPLRSISGTYRKAPFHSRWKGASVFVCPASNRLTRPGRALQFRSIGVRPSDLLLQAYHLLDESASSMRYSRRPRLTERLREGPVHPLRTPSGSPGTRGLPAPARRAISGFRSARPGSHPRVCHGLIPSASSGGSAVGESPVAAQKKRSSGRTSGPAGARFRRERA